MLWRSKLSARKRAGDEVEEREEEPKVRIIRDGSLSGVRYIWVRVDGFSDPMKVESGDTLVLQWQESGDELTVKFTKGPG